VEAAREISGDEAPRVEGHDFLNACITETLRQHPIGTWIRWAEKPFVLPQGPKGEARVIPCGFVAVTTMSIRADERIYKDADTYNPERYFQAPFVSKSEFKSTMTNAIRLDSVRAPPLNMTTAMQPSFGVGSHQCAGRFFAYHMISASLSFITHFLLTNLSQPSIATFISTLLESFDIEFYETAENAGEKHKTVMVPLFGTRELVSDVTIRLKRRDVPF